MNCISWNCRGLGSPRAIQELKALIRSHHPALIFLMETRLPSYILLFLKNSLGYSHGFAVDRSGQGGGLTMLWRDELDVQLISYSTGHIDVWIAEGIVDEGCFLTGFYGHWSVSQRRHS